jgi:hypothetical protein
LFEQVVIPSGKKVIYLTADSLSSDKFAILDDDTVVGWGRADHMGLGITDRSVYFTPVPLTDLGKVSAIVATGKQVHVVFQNESVAMWGNVMSNQGNVTAGGPVLDVEPLWNTLGESNEGFYPQPVDDGHPLHNYTGAPIMDAFGNTILLQTRPRVVDLGNSIKTIVGNQLSNCAIYSDDQVRCWGANKRTLSRHNGGDNLVSSGTLGVGSMTDFVEDPTLKTVHETLKPTMLAMAFGTTCALLSDRSVWCWGGNQYGLLGIGSSNETLVVSTPIRLDLSNVLQVNGYTSATGAYMCAYILGGDVMCWGKDYSNVLFVECNETTTSDPRLVYTPTLVKAFSRGWVQTTDGKINMRIALGTNFVLTTMTHFTITTEIQTQLGSSGLSIRGDPFDVQFPNNDEAAQVDIISLARVDESSRRASADTATYAQWMYNGTLAWVCAQSPANEDFSMAHLKNLHLGEPTWVFGYMDEDSNHTCVAQNSTTVETTTTPMPTTLAPTTTPMPTTLAPTTTPVPTTPAPTTTPVPTTPAPTTTPVPTTPAPTTTPVPTTTTTIVAGQNTLEVDGTTLKIPVGALDVGTTITASSLSIAVPAKGGRSIASKVVDIVLSTAPKLTMNIEMSTFSTTGRRRLLQVLNIPVGSHAVMHKFDEGKNDWIAMTSYNYNEHRGIMWTAVGKNDFNTEGSSKKIRLAIFIIPVGPHIHNPTTIHMIRLNEAHDSGTYVDGLLFRILVPILVVLIFCAILGCWFREDPTREIETRVYHRVQSESNGLLSNNPSLNPSYAPSAPPAPGGAAVVYPNFNPNFNPNSDSKAKFRPNWNTDFF